MPRYSYRLKCLKYQNLRTPAFSWLCGPVVKASRSYEFVQTGGSRVRLAAEPSFFLFMFIFGFRINLGKTKC
ncbi:hypothetical protein ACN38_g5537 [Penicillium nordicum]|uniref:Uncharacterized protein n=1 Tax=Penicillium nordicum TaxID=229535 RepID=A0A0M9WG42_9EURO|nr:hypothetical protein ACN38_g5537 [Penicillium nordicum]